MSRRKFKIKRSETVLEYVRKQRRWAIIRELSGSILSVLFIVAMFNEDFAFDLIKKFYFFLAFFLSQFWLNLFSVVLIGLFGGLLFWLRTWKRTWYGLIEISFALAYGWVCN